MISSKRTARVLVILGLLFFLASLLWRETLTTISAEGAWHLGTGLAGVALLLIAVGTSLSATSESSGGAALRTVAMVLPIILVSAFGAAFFVVDVLRPQFTRTSTHATDWASASLTDLRVGSVLFEVHEAGPSRALDRLEEVAATDTAVFLMGHHLAHTIGRMAVEESGFDPRVLAECRFVFASGCFHGVLEGYYRSRKEVRPEDVRTLCSTITAGEGLTARMIECSHGMGHGLAIYYGHDIFRALEQCEHLDIEVTRRECYDGVFMENAINAGTANHHGGSAPHGHGEVFAKPGDLAYPCNAVEERHAASCWAYQYVVARAFTGSDYDGLFETCSAAPERWATDCYFGMGKSFANTHFTDYGAITTACRLSDRRWQEACLAGAVEHLIDFDWTTNRAFRLCGSAGEDSRGSCYQRIGGRLGFLYANEPRITAECAKAGEEFAEACRAGAALGG